MQRWLAREQCFHRDPSLVRFYTGAGPRGLFDLSGNARHLTVESNNLSAGFAGISNNCKQGLSFAPLDWYQGVENDPGEPATRGMNQRYFDPKSSMATNSDVAFGVSDEFTVLCWVYGNHITDGPLVSVQGRYLPTGGDGYPYGIRGWSVGCMGNVPYLQMYSHKGIAGSISNVTSYSDWGSLEVYSDFAAYENMGIQEWSQVGVRYRGSAIPWGLAYNNFEPDEPSAYDADGYFEYGRTRREFIDFFHNGMSVGKKNAPNTTSGQIDIHKSTNYSTGVVGTNLVSGQTVVEEPMLFIGSALTPNYGNYTSTTEKVYNFCRGPACLFRVYRRALSDNEIKAIFDREQFLLQYKPFQGWAADESAGISFFMSGSDSRTASMFLYAGSSQEVNSSIPLFTHGNGLSATGAPLYAGSGEEHNSYIPMHCNGLGFEIAAVPLYTFNSENITNQIPLSAVGGMVSTVSIPLFTNGIFADSIGVPLFAAADPIPSMEAGVPLSLFGSTHEGMTKGIPLYAYAADDANVAGLGIPMFVKAVDQSQFSVLMNLYASGEAHSANAGLDMVAWNTQLGLSNGITLFVKGDGVTDGAVPFGKGINLVLKRDPTAAMPLFAQAPGEQLGTGTTLYVYGVVPNHASVDMAVPNVVGLLVSPVKLYTTGF